MKRFSRKDEGDARASRPPSERLQAFTQSLWQALVPASGPCASIQGELVRARGRLTIELRSSGMENFFQREEPGLALADTYLGGLLLFMLDTLAHDRSGALSASDLAYFAAVREAVEPEWLRVVRENELLERADGEELTAAEQVELAQLEEGRGGVDWEGLLDRAERCIANYCLANPALVDRGGDPLMERGVADVRHVFEPPPAPPPCPRCNGKGWLPATTPGDFPSFCSCKRPSA